jgi:hypothetical protein
MAFAIFILPYFALSPVHLQRRIQSRSTAESWKCCAQYRPWMILVLHVGDGIRKISTKNMAANKSSQWPVLILRLLPTQLDVLEYVT